MPKTVDVCAGCGTGLDAPDAICPACNPPSRPGSPGTTVGKFVCPACHTRFGAAELRPWPPTAPWYKPQGYASQCPNCQAYLQDRRTMPLLSGRLGLGLFAGFLVGNFLLVRINLQWVLFPALCVGLVGYWWHEWRKDTVIPDEQRYIPMPPP